MNRRDVLKTIAIVPLTGSLAPLAINAAPTIESTEVLLQVTANPLLECVIQSLQFAQVRGSNRCLLEVNGTGYTGKAKLRTAKESRAVEFKDGRLNADWIDGQDVLGFQFEHEDFVIDWLYSPENLIPCIADEVKPSALADAPTPQE